MTLLPNVQAQAARSAAGAASKAAAVTAAAAAAATNAPPKEIWGSHELNRLTYIDVAAKYAGQKHDPVNEYSTLPSWSVADVQHVKVNHKPPTCFVDHVAYRAVRMCRWGFDTVSGYRFGKISERKVINRCLFLETVAGVPGMVAGMLRRMRKDHGWIQTLLDEAENERMHLMTFIEIRQPGLLFRLSILATQGIMFNLLFLLYMVSPKFVHRFVGYLEEEAVITYTQILEKLHTGQLPNSKIAVPAVAREYWSLKDEASFTDLIAVIRADEAEHRVVNHTFADMHAQHLQHAANPFPSLKSAGSPW